MCVFILQKKKSIGIVMKMLFAVLVVDVCEFSVLLVKKLLLFVGGGCRKDSEPRHLLQHRTPEQSLQHVSHSEELTFMKS